MASWDLSSLVLGAFRRSATSRVGDGRRKRRPYAAALAAIVSALVLVGVNVPGALASVPATSGSEEEFVVEMSEEDVSSTLFAAQVEPYLTLPQTPEQEENTPVDGEATLARLEFLNTLEEVEPLEQLNKVNPEFVPALEEAMPPVGTVPSAARVQSRAKAKARARARAAAAQPGVYVEMRQRAYGSSYTAEKLEEKAPFHAEYEILVTNVGQSPVQVENIADPNVGECTTTGPKQPELQPQEADVVEVVCEHEVKTEGETFKNIAALHIGGEEQLTNEVEIVAKSKGCPPPTCEGAISYSSQQWLEKHEELFKALGRTAENLRYSTESVSTTIKNEAERKKTVAELKEAVAKEKHKIAKDAAAEESQAKAKGKANPVPPGQNIPASSPSANPQATLANTNTVAKHDPVAKELTIDQLASSNNAASAQGQQAPVPGSSVADNIKTAAHNGIPTTDLSCPGTPAVLRSALPALRPHDGEGGAKCAVSATGVKNDATADNKALVAPSGTNADIAKSTTTTVASGGNPGTASAQAKAQIDATGPPQTKIDEKASLDKGLDDKIPSSTPPPTAPASAVAKVDKDAKTLEQATKDAERIATDAEKDAKVAANEAKEAITLASKAGAVAADLADPMMLMQLLSAAPELIMSIIKMVNNEPSPEQLEMEQLQNITEMLGKLTEITSEGFTGVDAGLASIAQQLGTITHKLETLEGGVASIEQSVGKVGEQIGTLESDFYVSQSETEKTKLNGEEEALLGIQALTGQELASATFVNGSQEFYDYATRFSTQAATTLNPNLTGGDAAFFKESKNYGASGPARALDYLDHFATAEGWSEKELKDDLVNPDVFYEGDTALAELWLENDNDRKAYEKALTSEGKTPQLTKAREFGQQDAEAEGAIGREGQRYAPLTTQSPKPMRYDTASTVLDHALQNYLAQAANPGEGPEAGHQSLLATLRSAEDAPFEKEPNPALTAEQHDYENAANEPEYSKSDLCKDCTLEYEKEPLVNLWGGATQHDPLPPLKDATDPAGEHTEGGKALPNDADACTSAKGDVLKYQPEKGSDFEGTNGTSGGHIEPLPVNQIPLSPKTTQEQEALFVPLPPVFENAWHLGLGELVTCYEAAWGQKELGHKGSGGEETDINYEQNSLIVHLNWYWRKPQGNEDKRLLSVDVHEVVGEYAPRPGGCSFFVCYSHASDTKCDERVGGAYREVMPADQFLGEWWRAPKGEWCSYSKGNSPETALATFLEEIGTTGEYKTWLQTGQSGEATYCNSKYSPGKEEYATCPSITPKGEKSVAEGAITESGHGWWEKEGFETQPYGEVTNEVEAALKRRQVKTYDILDGKEAQPELTKELEEASNRVSGARLRVDDLVKLGLPRAYEPASKTSDPLLRSLIDGADCSAVPPPLESLGHWQKEIKIVKEHGSEREIEIRRFIVNKAADVSKGEEVRGPGIPAGTTVTLVDGDVVELSPEATKNETGRFVFVKPCAHHLLDNSNVEPGEEAGEFELSHFFEHAATAAELAEQQWKQAQFTASPVAEGITPQGKVLGGVSSFADIRVGAEIQGAGVGPGTTVTEVNVGQKVVVLSNPVLVGQRTFLVVAPETPTADLPETDPTAPGGTLEEAILERTEALAKELRFDVRTETPADIAKGTAYPSVETGGLVPIANTGTVLVQGGTVNPNNSGPITSCEVEYGTTPALGSKTPCLELPAQGDTDTNASVGAMPVTGLAICTEYHFRLVVGNKKTTQTGSTGGENRGEDTSVVTGEPLCGIDGDARHAAGGDARPAVHQEAPPSSGEEAETACENHIREADAGVGLALALSCLEESSALLSGESERELKKLGEEEANAKPASTVVPSEHHESTIVPENPPQKETPQKETPRSPTAVVSSVHATGPNVTLTIACTNAPCSISALEQSTEHIQNPGNKLLGVTASTHGKPKRISKVVLVGSSPMTLAAGKSVTLTIKLNSTGSKLLAKFGRLPVELLVKLTPSGGHALTVKQTTLTLTKAKPKKK